MKWISSIVTWTESENKFSTLIYGCYSSTTYFNLNPCYHPCLKSHRQIHLAEHLVHLIRLKYQILKFNVAREEAYLKLILLKAKHKLG